MLSFKKAFFFIYLFVTLYPVPSSAISSEDYTRYAESAIGRTIGNYTFIDQDGKPFNIREFFGKPFIVSFIYTSCPHICPTILGNLNTAIKKAEDSFGRSFNVLTISFDEDDTPIKLKAYGSIFTDDFKNWRFVTADKETIESITREFGFYYKRDGRFFEHINMVSIVDSKGRIYTHIYGIDFKPDEVLNPLMRVIKDPAAEPVKRSFKRVWWNPFIDTVKLLCSTYNPVTKKYEFDITRLIGMIISAVTILTIFLIVWGRDVRNFMSRKVLGR